MSLSFTNQLPVKTALAPMEGTSRQITTVLPAYTTPTRVVTTKPVVVATPPPIIVKDVVSVPTFRPSPIAPVVSQPVAPVVKSVVDVRPVIAPPVVKTMPVQESVFVPAPAMTPLPIPVLSTQSKAVLSDIGLSAPAKAAVIGATGTPNVTAGVPMTEAKKLNPFAIAGIVLAAIILGYLLFFKKK